MLPLNEIFALVKFNGSRLISAESIIDVVPFGILIMPNGILKIFNNKISFSVFENNFLSIYRNLLSSKDLTSKENTKPSLHTPKTLVILLRLQFEPLFVNLSFLRLIPGRFNSNTSFCDGTLEFLFSFSIIT